jgi:hypothetical protein
MSTKTQVIGASRGGAGSVVIANPGTATKTQAVSNVGMVVSQGSAGAATKKGGLLTLGAGG